MRPVLQPHSAHVHRMLGALAGATAPSWALLRARGLLRHLPNGILLIQGATCLSSRGSRKPTSKCLGARPPRLSKPVPHSEARSGWSRGAAAALLLQGRCRQIARRSQAGRVVRHSRCRQNVRRSLAHVGNQIGSEDGGLRVGVRQLPAASAAKACEDRGLRLCVSISSSTAATRKGARLGVRGDGPELLRQLISLDRP